MTTFILCAGRQSRWGPTTIKQLLPVEGEVLINRTVRQVKEVDPKGVVWVVSHREELANIGHEILVPPARRCTCETILSVSSYWGDYNVVLLGDVYYPDEAIRDIFTVRNTLTFYGDTGDFFGLSFPDGASGEVAWGLRDAVLKHSSGKLPTGPILEMYRSLGCPLHKLWVISDRTQDFDCEEDYKNFLNGITKNVMLKRKAT